MKPTIGIIGGSGLYSMPGFEGHEERTVDDALGRALGRLHRGPPGGQGSRVPLPARPRASYLAFGAEFSRQHLGHEIAGCRAHSFAQRGRLAEGRTQASRFRDSLPVRRSHARTRIYVFRRRAGRAHQLRASDLHPDGRCRLRRRPGRGRTRQARRHVPVHGRSGVFDAGGIESVSQLGHGRDRHDQPCRKPSSRARPSSATPPSPW